MIELVWEVNKEWEEQWGSWKVGRFVDIQTADMESQSNTLYKKLNKLSRELKVRLLSTFIYLKC